MGVVGWEVEGVEGCTNEKHAIFIDIHIFYSLDR